MTRRHHASIARSYRRRRCAFYLLVLLALWAGSAGEAFASSSGPAMPWDSALNNLQANLTGPAARAMVIIATAIGACMWAFTDHGSGLRRISQVVFAGGICFGAPLFLTSLGFSGATF